MRIKTLWDIFFNGNKQFANNCAVIYCDGEAKIKKISYQQLASECLKVEKCLQELSVSGFIGVSGDQNVSLLAIILGILCCKLPFTYIDINNTEESFQYMMNYLNIKWVICKEEDPIARATFCDVGNMIVSLRLNGEKYVMWHISNFGSYNNRDGIFHASLNLAYAIQSSGSTGTPKIIRVPHDCIVPNILDISEHLNITEEDVIFLGSPLTFDPSIIELFLPFTKGAALFITPTSIRVSPPQLLDVLFPLNKPHFSGITVLQTTPSSFLRWTSADIKMRILSNTSSLKKLLFGGEPCPNISVLKSWREDRNSTDIFNVYGITEVSCWATLQKVEVELCEETPWNDSLNVVPLGSPLSETELKVLNREGEQVFLGEGELYIGSSSRVCLVNEEVLENLTLPIFRATGDIVKFTDRNKHIKFLGRKNRIIKRWGHQICLSDIEKTLRECENVESCCCVWNQLKHHLAAFIVWSREGETLNLRKYCNTHLHKSAIPDLLITAKFIPLTKHGKVDYEALQLLVLENLSGQIKNKEDSDLLPSRLLSAWVKILGAKPQQTDNFAQSGGNSILALQLSSELEQFYGEHIRNKCLTLLFSNSSFIEISENLKFFVNDSETELDIESSQVNNMEKESGTEESTCEIEKSKLHSNPLHLTKNRNKAFFNRKRKSSSVTSEQEKIFVNKEANLEINKIKSSDCENKLIATYYRGKVVMNVHNEDTAPDLSKKKCSLQLNWKFNMKRCVDASPTCLKFSRGSYITVGSHSHLLTVLKCSSGELISKCELPDRIESSVCPSPCGRYGIVGCYDGCVYCICLTNGNVKWCYRTGDVVKSSPVLCQNETAVVIGSYDSNLYCIQLMDGKLIWKTSASSGSIYSTPCVSKNGSILYGTLDGICLAISEQDGLTLWKKTVSSPVFSSPALLNSYNAVVFIEVIGIVHCFGLNNGENIWKYKADGNVFSSISSLYFSSHCYELLNFGCHDKNLYCLKLENNRQDVILQWKKELDSAVYATPFIFPIKKLHSDIQANCTVLPIISTFVMCASTKGTVYVIDAEYGLVHLSKSLESEIFSSPVVCDDKVFVGCRDDFLYCFNIKEEDPS